MLSTFSAAAAWVKMAREYVDSTSIEWFRYEPRARRLDVEFVSGGIYRYADVPGAVVDELRAAESKGRYINQEIKPYYRCERIRATRR
jgi:uncharacterized membrane protein